MLGFINYALVELGVLGFHLLQSSFDLLNVLFAVDELLLKFIDYLVLVIFNCLSSFSSLSLQHSFELIDVVPVVNGHSVDNPTQVFRLICEQISNFSQTKYFKIGSALDNRALEHTGSIIGLIGVINL